MFQPRGVAIALLVLAALGCRLIPYVLHQLGMPVDPEVTVYPWNFSPILPFCLLGAACFSSRVTAFVAPLGIYLAGDIAIWLLTGRVDWAFYAGQPVLYLSVLLVVASGLLLRNQRSWSRVALVGFGSAVIFFLVSNFGVWALGGGQRYALNLAGLVDCYVQAIPFFRNTLISMLIFLPIMFSPLILSERKRPILSAA